MAPVSQPVDPALASQLSNHKLFDGSCDGRTITATVFLNDTRKCPAMLGRIAVTKVQRCKHPDSVEHEVVLSEVVCLDDARKPIDHAVISFERYIKAVGKPNPSSAKRRPLAKTSADVRASSSDSSCGSGENSAADTLCSYHSKSFPTIEGRKLTVMSEMVFPIDGENIFLIEEFATMAEVISASAPVYNVATTNCYWFASSLMEMAVQEKAGKIKIHQTKQKAGTVRGVDVNFQPHPSQKVPALRVKYAESWERYQGDIQIAKLRIEQERDELLKPTQDEVKRERAEKEDALRREEGALRREEGALKRAEDALRRAEAAEAKLALLTSMQTS